MSYRVSVIVPVYNTKTEYLTKCIESVLSDNPKDVQLILIDDGSSNDAPLVCQKYADRENVLYLSQSNQGVSVARNNGLDHADGKYIVFVDSDDFVTQGAISKLADMADEYEEKGRLLDILFFGYCTSYTNREMVRVINKVDESVFESERLQLAILQGDAGLGVIEIGAPWGKLIRRTTIDDNCVRYTPGLRKGQDTVFSLNLLKHCREMTYAPIAGYHYRMSGVSISHRYNEEIFEIMEKTIEAYSKVVSGSSDRSRFERALDIRIFRILTNEYMDLYFVHPDNKNSSRQNKTMFKTLLKKEMYSAAINNISGDAKVLKSMSVLDKYDLVCIKNQWLGFFWIKKKLLNFARSIIVRNYR